MNNERYHYVDGAWVKPIAGEPLDVVNPSTEEAFTQIIVGGPEDVDRAVAAARSAFKSYSRTTAQQRLEILHNILAQHEKRREDLAHALSQEMGAPYKFAYERQTTSANRHITRMIQVLENYSFTETHGTTRIVREPIGVVGLITPWNWPINEMASKVIAAIAAGCTMVLKPSEESPISAVIWSEVLDAAGVPKGVYNMVQGVGAVVGEAMSAHPAIDMISFTGSTRAGISVSRAAAATIKRVSMELGGKSANIILDDADIQDAVSRGVLAVMANSGQSCDAPTRMLVPAQKHEEAMAAAKATAEKLRVGDVLDPATDLGPVVNRAQFEKIQRYIQSGIEEGADLVTGGVGRPSHLNKGYFVKPTVFANVSNDMSIARDEIFGPVVCIIPYEGDEDAIRIANDSVYGLAGYVQSRNLERARAVATEVRAGCVNINYAPGDTGAPFGGYKQSGNGREKGKWGLENLLEIKALVGYEPA